MNFPFTSEQFFEVFIRYNTAVWPMQLVFYSLALSTVYTACNKSKRSSKIASGILSFYWIWMGLVYHILFFSTINPIAKLFGIFFVMQGLFFLFEGVIRNRLQFSFESTLRKILGLCFMFFGTVIYPILGYFLGHVYPSSPTFGLPCPTTIFTFGLLLLTKPSRYIVFIPFIWSIIGFTAALKLEVYEDISLLIAGVISSVVIFHSKKKFIPIHV